MGGACRFLTRKPAEKGPLGQPRHRYKNNNLGIGIRTMLKEFYKIKQNGRLWSALIWLRIGTRDGLL
jgi:hypothetical protein